MNKTNILWNNMDGVLIAMLDISFIREKFSFIMTKKKNKIPNLVSNIVISYRHFITLFPWTLFTTDK